MRQHSRRIDHLAICVIEGSRRKPIRRVALLVRCAEIAPTNQTFGVTIEPCGGGIILNHFAFHDAGG